MLIGVPQEWIKPMLDEVIYMQVRLFRMFREKFKLTTRETNRIFSEQGIWNFIEECYESLHVEGDGAVLSEIEKKLVYQGIVL